MSNPKLEAFGAELQILVDKYNVMCLLSVIDVAEDDAIGAVLGTGTVSKITKLLHLSTDIALRVVQEDTVNMVTENIVNSMVGGSNAVTH